MAIITGIPSEAPVIVRASAVFDGPSRPLLVVGDQVSLTVTVTGAVAAPTATLFNGLRTAIVTSQLNVFTFSYTIQAGDNGPVTYRVVAKADAGVQAEESIIDSSRSAGMVSCGRSEFLGWHCIIRLC